jgi:hypothetical protein
MSTIRRISDRASVSVAVELVDPCQVIAGPSAREGVRHDIEIAIDARVVLHELQQCEIDVTEDSLLDFVATDARGEPGRDGYLTITRFVIHPLPPLSGLRHTITPRWAWTETAQVAIDDGLVKFRGRCVPV